MHVSILLDVFRVLLSLFLLQFLSPCSLNRSLLISSSRINRHSSVSSSRIKLFSFFFFLLGNPFYFFLAFFVRSTTILSSILFICSFVSCFVYFFARFLFYFLSSFIVFVLFSFFSSFWLLAIFRALEHEKLPSQCKLPDVDFAGLVGAVCLNITALLDTLHYLWIVFVNSWPIPGGLSLP